MFIVVASICMIVLPIYAIRPADDSIPKDATEFHTSFTTYERIERPGMMVRKRSGSREAFDREKLMRAVRNSVGKYFDSDLDVQSVVDQVEELIYDQGKDEVPSSLIGETILEVLSDTNEMAYVPTSLVNVKRLYALDYKDDFTYLLKQYLEEKRQDVCYQR